MKARARVMVPETGAANAEYLETQPAADGP